jgi:hypothetical protein
MRGTLRFAAFALPVFGSVVGFIQQPEPKLLQTVQNTYLGPHVGKIEVLGVCEFGLNSVRCWNTKREDLPSLAERMKAYYLMNSQQEISYQFGKKNRSVVFRRKTPNAQGPLKFTHYTGPTNEYLSVRHLPWNGNEPVTEWTRIAVDEDVAETHLHAQLSQAVSGTLELPFEEGSKGTLDLMSVALKPLALAKPTDFSMRFRGYGDMSARPGKYWIANYEAKGLYENRLQADWTALDKSGQPIRYVDSKGRVVSQEKYNLERQSNVRHMRFQDLPNQVYEYRNAFLQPHSQSGTSSILTNIDPKHLAKARILLTRYVQVKFTNIPLDPK